MGRRTACGAPFHIDHVLILRRLTKLTKYWVCLSCVLTVLGCTPELNWRMVSSSQNQVQLLMPCKPDAATRTVTMQVNLQAVSTQLHMQACEAGNKQFAIAELTVPDKALANDLRDAWRLASLASLQANESQATLDIKMITNVTTPSHKAQFVWRISEQTVYQAAIYAKPNDKGFAEAADAFMSGIKWP